MPLIRRFLELRRGRTANLWQYDFFRVNRRDQDFSTTCIHGIDTVRFLAGCSYRRVEFAYRPIAGAEDWVVDILMDCEFQDGSAGQLTFSPMTGIVAERCTMHGTNQLIACTLPYHGSIKPADGPEKILLAENGRILLEEGTPAGEDDFVSNGFYGENAAFLDCIQAGGHPEGDILSGLQSVEIARLYPEAESSVSGRPLIFDRKNRRLTGLIRRRLFFRNNQTANLLFGPCGCPSYGTEGQRLPE